MRLHVLAAAAAFTVLAVRPAFGQDLVVDTTGAGALIDEAFNRSEVMQNLQYLRVEAVGLEALERPIVRPAGGWRSGEPRTDDVAQEIGRASCRERV